MIEKLYDEKDPLSIEAFGQRMIGKTFAEIWKEDCAKSEDYAEKHEDKKRKGGLGELIEECFFTINVIVTLDRIFQKQV